MAAIRAGKSLGNTMGFTALDGLPMGTRCGQIDPGVLIYLMQQRGLTLDQVEDLLYNHSGLKGLSGVSNDMRDLLASDQPGATVAIDYFVYRIGRELGSLAAVAGGPGRPGVHRRHRRARRRDPRGSAATRPGWASRSTTRRTAGVARGSRRGAVPSVWVIPTDEELMIARHTLRLLGGVSSPRKKGDDAR